MNGKKHYDIPKNTTNESDKSKISETEMVFKKIK